MICGRPSKCRASQTLTVNWVTVQAVTVGMMCVIFVRFGAAVTVNIDLWNCTPVTLVLERSPYRTDGKTDRRTDGRNA